MKSGWDPDPAQDYPDVLHYRNLKICLGTKINPWNICNVTKRPNTLSFGNQESTLHYCVADYTYGKYPNQRSLNFAVGSNLFGCPVIESWGNAPGEYQR